jgi:D-ribose pyranose/furanose isomerase RbsD
MNWQTKLKEELPLLGHRNWIVIADSAYPWQTAAGIETVDTGAEQLEVTKAVLDALSQTKHVQPIIYTDVELKYVAEADAPGVTAYREQLSKLLKNSAVQVLPHEDIIKKLDAAGQTFHVLLLKTKHIQPYTSVFLQLECGYWNDAAEKRLRAALRAGE